jgi:hypothetical protein
MKRPVRSSTPFSAGQAGNLLLRKIIRTLLMRTAKRNKNILLRLVYEDKHLVRKGWYTNLSAVWAPADAMMNRAF